VSTTEQAPLFDEVGDPTARREDDFYETFRWQVEALLRRVTLPKEWMYLEPCSGNLAIAGPLRDRGLHVWANDLVQRDAPLDSTLDARDERLWNAVRTCAGRSVDLSVTNVPFAEAFGIVPGALERSRHGVITLVRCTWDEPTEDRDEWLAAHPCTAKIIMPRAKYRGTAGSDSATHAWFLWTTPGVIAKPHDVVTRRERDELVTVYGAGRWRAAA
jgi:hypothetical protein